MLRRRTAAAGLAMVLSLATACAGGRAEPDPNADPARRFMVRVNNNRIPSQVVTVFLAPNSGARQLLGTVAPNQVRVFDDFTPVGSQYRLVAQTERGGTIASRTFIVGTADQVRWDLNLNRIFLGEQDGD